MAREPRPQPTAVIDESDSRWHVDRKIPLALVLTIFAQTAGIIWWGATMHARIEVLEHKAEIVAPQADRLTRLEVQVDTIKDGIQEIKGLLRPAVKR